MITRKKYTSLVIVGLGLIAFTACQRDPNDRGWEYAPQMYRSVPYEPLRQYGDEKNRFNPYGINMREPVKGTVVRKINQNPYAVGMVNDIMVYNIPKDSIEIAERTLINPIPKNDTTIAEGKFLYENVCQPCHGANGEGDGTVGKVYKGVPNYKAGAYKTMNDGHIFHTITHGKGRMWPHGSQLTPEERWKIVLYVHELQNQ